MAKVLEANPNLTSLELSNNGIGGRGGIALLKALRNPAAPYSEGGATKAGMASSKPICGLQELQLDGNLLSAELDSALHQQLLLNNLPRLFQGSLTAAPAIGPPRKAKSRKGAADLTGATVAAAQALPIRATLKP